MNDHVNRLPSKVVPCNEIGYCSVNGSPRKHSFKWILQTKNF
jgi:hypothetical protein